MSSQSGVATTPTRGGLRLLRAAALGGSSLALAGGAHLAGGGRLPGPATLGALALLVGTVAVALTGRRCRGPLLIGVLGIEQFALHIVLSAAAAPVRWADPGGAVHSALGHSALGHSALDHLTLPAAAQSGAAATMLVAHLLATVATAWLLARGEAWFWRVASQAMRILRAGPGHGWRPRRDVAPEFGLADVVVAYLGGDGAPRGPPAAGTLRVI